MVVSYLRKLLRYCGLENHMDRFFIFLIYFSLLLGLFSFMFSRNVFLSILLLFGVPLAIQTTIFATLYLISVARAKRAEKYLPNLLELLSSNLKSGVPINEAIIISAKPEFGVLSKEFLRVSKESLTAQSIYNSFKKIGDKFNSEIIRRTFNILSEGISKGGDISKLLFSLARDIKSFQLLEKERLASLSAQIGFIIIAVIFAVPFLIGGSVAFISQVSHFKIYEVSLQMLYSFSVLFLMTNAVFSALIVGVIVEGKKSAGAKYMPLFILVSLVVYFVVKGAFSSVLAL